MLVNELVTQIKTRLKQTFDDPILCQQYAQWLVQALTQKSELELISTQKIEWSTYQQSHLDDILDKIINQSMPLAYVLGSMPFAGLEILIHPPILIPRAETEEWVCNLIDQMHGSRRLQMLFRAHRYMPPIFLIRHWNLPNKTQNIIRFQM